MASSFLLSFYPFWFAKSFLSIATLSLLVTLFSQDLSLPFLSTFKTLSFLSPFKSSFSFHILKFSIFSLLLSSKMSDFSSYFYHSISNLLSSFYFFVSSSIKLFSSSLFYLDHSDIFFLLCHYSLFLSILFTDY